jgi:peptidoglycan/xylan/chitin deacetylase (PgdA/CDA1 family)
MTRRWNWDFDDHRRAGKTSSSPSTPSPPPDPRKHPQRAHIRRRRGAAVLVLIVVVALAVGVLAGSHHDGAASGAGMRDGKHTALTHSASANAARGQPASDREDDQNAAVSAVLAYTPFVKEGGERGREVALTFDDGPGPYTPGVLSVLERFHVHATFFEIGEMLRYFSASTVRALQDGDVIGDHTETHPYMATLSAHQQHEELFEQIARIELAGGPRPVLFRPPYGSYDATTMRELKKLHLLMVLWSVDTDDYLQPGVSVIVERALAGAHPGAIILMHDAGGTRTQTIEALPSVIRGLRDRGYRLVTVPQLLKDDPPPPGRTLPSSLSGD